MTEHTRPLEGRHRLQNILLTAHPGCEALYSRRLGEAAASAQATDPRSIPPGCILRLDTLLNTFFERYWRDLTGLKTLALLVETSGSCRIRILRRCAGGAETVLADALTSRDLARTILPVSLESLPADDAVIHGEIEAAEGTVVLHDGAWLTDDPPRNAVRLAIVTCSFGQEEMLVDNLRRMRDIITRTSEIAEVLIVHQGKRDLADLAAYSALQPATSFAGKLRLVRQDNFGGTGGFARGVLESLDAGASHILLLDDDIRIEPAVLERLAVLLSYLTAETTIGGQALELDQPTSLQASHETVTLAKLQLRNPCKGLDLSASNLADLFGRRNRSDYNAWWFCCIPATTFRRIGLPVPMFLRLDDVEYGIRTIRSGASLVTMPGLFVWHKRYAMKNGAPSFVYYERRNFLIAAALHDQLDLIDVLRRHGREAWGALRRHHYAYCWALCRAMEDFLAGPSLVFSDISVRHRQLAVDQARFTLLTMKGIRQHESAANGRGASHRVTILSAVLRGTKGLTAADAKLAAMVRQLAFTILRTSLALVLRGHRVSRAYRADAATCTSPAFWRRLLALPPAPEPSP